MKKPYKDIRDFIESTVKKSKVVILGVCFMLSPVALEASSDYQEHSFENVEVVGEALPVTESYEAVEFELSDNQDSWQIILDNLAEYPDNWDGEGAKAVNPATIENCRHLLHATSKYKALLDDVFPTELGTVCLQWFDDDTESLVNAEISPDRMAFYADVPGRDVYDFKPAPFGKYSIDELSSFLETLI